MYDFVATYINDNALYFINTKDTPIVNRIEAPILCNGIKGIASSNELIYFCCAHSNNIWCFNRVTKSFKQICETIGIGPNKIYPWNNYLIVSCRNTDSVEICLKNGGQSFISNKIGDIAIYKEMCFCTCLISCEIYVLSLPFLETVSVYKLPFYPYSLHILNDELCIMGVYDDSFKLMKIDPYGKTETLCIINHLPLSCAFYKEIIYLVCPFDNLLYEFNKNKTSIIKCNKIKPSPQMIASDGEGILLSVHNEHNYEFTYKDATKASKHFFLNAPASFKITSLTAL